MTFQPAISDRSISGTLTAVSQTVILPLGSEGQSAWFLQITGTFVGSIVTEVSGDGVNYLPFNFRQTVLGKIGNTTTIPGIFRGACAGASHIRVRASNWTSGTANITLRTSIGIGAIFSNSLQEVRELEQYYSSVAGGNIGFTATVGLVNIAGSGGCVAIFYNPSESLADLYISRITVGNNKAGSFQRFRSSGVNTAPITTPVASNNRGGGSNVAVGKLYPGTTISGGIASRTIFLPATGSNETLENGASIIRPGQLFYWLFTPDAANQSSMATVNVCWWETTATT